MLTRALRLIASGEVGAAEDLARELGVSATMARGLVEQLVRLGYLRPSAGACAAACDKCPRSSGCFTGPQLWALTEKGRRAASPTDAMGGR